MRKRSIVPIRNLIAFVLMVCVLTPFAASANQSTHTSVDMVWNAGSFDCETLPMTLVDDYVWECVAPIGSTETYYIQFWPGDSLDPKYGADLLDPSGLVLDDDPSQVPVTFAQTGYHVIRLLESVPAFEVVGAPGSIVVNLTFSDAPDTPPADAAVAVLDLDFDHVLGSFPAGAGNTVQIVNLVPGRTYELMVTASGYDDEIISVNVPGTDPVAVPVTLDRLVSNEQSTWSGMKTLYR